jgi:hypothetical protein
MDERGRMHIKSSLHINQKIYSLDTSVLLQAYKSLVS